MTENNNIENQFRSAFNDFIPHEDWNTPNDNIWNNIDKSLGKSKKRRNIWPLLCLLVGIVGLVSTTYFYLELKDSNTGETNKLSHTIQDKIEGKVTPRVIHKSTSEQSIISENQRLKALISISSDRKQEHNEKYEKNKRNTFLNPPEKNVLISIAEENNIKGINKNKSTTNDLFPTAKLALADLPKIKSRRSEVISTIIIIPEPKYDNIIIPTKVYKDASYLSKNIQFSKSILNTARVNGIVETEIIDKEYGALSYGLEIELSKEIGPQIYASIGLSYQKQKYFTEYDLRLPYNHDLEHSDGVHGSVHFSHSLPTFAGNIDTELILSRNLNDDISDDELVDLDFDTKTTVQQVGIPIGLKYFIGQNRKGFFIGLELQPSFVLSTSQGLERVLSHHQLISNSHAGVASEGKKINGFQLFGGISAGYEIPLSQHLNFGLSVNYLNGLTTLVDSGNYTSNVNFIGVGLGLTSTF